MSSVGGLVCAFRWCQSDAVPLFLHEGQININCLYEKKKKKISSTLMGQESSENFIYTFTKKMQICNVRLRHRLSSLFIQEGGPDKT